MQNWKYVSNLYIILLVCIYTESVTLEFGIIKAISDIKVGDRVLAADSFGNTLFSEVIFIPHSANMDQAEFIHVITEDKDLKMTKNHILPSGLCKSNLPLVHASEVNVGDCVQTVSGQETVTSISTVRGNGVYTIVTNEEYIVVNGVIASSFGANHMMANLFYNIHRFLYALAPALLTSSLLHTANEVRINIYMKVYLCSFFVHINNSFYFFIACIGPGHADPFIRTLTKDLIGGL